MEFLKGKNIVVTGAAGLVGTHTLLRLRDMQDVRIRAVFHARQLQVASPNIVPVRADLTKAEDCCAVVEGMDYLLMFAAKIDRRASSLAPVLQTLAIDTNMLNAAHQAGVKKLLWLSSTMAYPCDGTILEEGRMFEGDPHDSYFALGWTTRYVEKLCQAYALKLTRPMPTVVLRPSTIYGPWGDFDYATSHVFSALIRRVVERQNPIEVWGTGETRRDFVYADDVVDACLMALEQVNDFAALNVGMGKTYSVKETLQAIIDADGYAQARVTFDPSKPAKAPSIAIDCAAAAQVIGFKAKTSLREGIIKTIAWLRQGGSACFR